MIWIYIVSTDGITCNKRGTKYAFREYLRSLGFSAESYDDVSNHSSLIIKEESGDNDLPYHCGDIIYFFSGREFSKIHIDREKYRYVDRNEFLAWQGFNKKGVSMKFRELNVGDVFRINNGDSRKYIKISTISDAYKYYNYAHKDHPINMFILDNEHYGSLSPNADVTLIREYPETESPSYFQQNSEYDTRIVENQMNRWASNPDTAVQYAVQDICITKKLLDMTCVTVPEIKKVIFNNPATIVIWVDGSKTVVICQDGEEFDKEKGLALCYMKKALGNKGNFNNIFREWIKSDPDLVKSKISNSKPKNKDRKILPAGRVRLTAKESVHMISHLHRVNLTEKMIASASGLSVKTVKRVFSGLPVTKKTMMKICQCFPFSIKTTRYAEG